MHAWLSFGFKYLKSHTQNKVYYSPLAESHSLFIECLF